MDHYLIFTGDVDIVLIPATITPITQVAMVDRWVYHFLFALLKKMLMNMIDSDIVVMAIGGEI